MLRHLDLFSGIGGFALAARMVGGYETVAFCEIEPYCRAVLRKNFPGVRIYDDVRTLSGVECDIITGGPPCQRTSVAAAIHGNRTGETLWPHQLRLIAESGARAIVEQPPGNAQWERAVKAGMEASGYAVARYVIAARSVGALHLRRRLFFIADRDRARLALTRARIASALECLSRGSVNRNPWTPAVAATVRVDDGLPGGVDRRKRIHAIGNAVVPQVAAIFLEAIRQVSER